MAKCPTQPLAPAFGSFDCAAYLSFPPADKASAPLPRTRPRFRAATTSPAERRVTSADVESEAVPLRNETGGMNAEAVVAASMSTATAIARRGAALLASIASSVTSLLLERRIL